MVRPFTSISILAFSLIAIMHLLRLFFGWAVIVDGLIIPTWISVPGVLIGAVLALMLWKESRK